MTGRIVTSFFHDFCERFQLLDGDDIVEIGARVVEVRADVILDFLAHRFHLRVEDALDEGHAASASCAGFCAALDIADALAGAVLHAGHYITLGNVVT